MLVEKLRSPYDRVGNLVHFGRMVDKIRLHAAGTLPSDYQANLGSGFDGYCCNFLLIAYPALVERVKQGGDDESILAWALAEGRKPSDEEIEIWNEFLRKRGWNDDRTSVLQSRLREIGLEQRTDIQTMFDFIDLDEGRK